MTTVKVIFRNQVYHYHSLPHRFLETAHRLFNVIISSLYFCVKVCQTQLSFYILRMEFFFKQKLHAMFLSVTLDEKSYARYSLTKNKLQETFKVSLMLL